MARFFRILLFNFKVETKFKLDYIFRLFMYCFHILVFSDLWDYLLKGRTLHGYDKTRIIWYIIIGEAIIYSMSRNYIKISNLIKNGDIVNIIVKPIGILEYLFINEFTSIVNMFINIAIAFFFGILYIGFPDIRLINIILFIPAMFISYLLILFCQIIIGILAFFFEDNDVFYLIISKAILVVTMSPLDFFDGIIYKVLSILPTTYIVYVPGKIFLNCRTKAAINLLLIQFIEFCCVFVFVKFLARKGVEKVNVNGG